MSVPYGQGNRMLSLSELCEWLNITERHARKLVGRGAIPYRKIGHLLRFPEAEVEAWSRPTRTLASREASQGSGAAAVTARRRPGRRPVLPKSLID